jgi:hypothetical protein
MTSSLYDLKDHRLTMSDEDLDNSIVSHSTTTFRKRRRRNISTQNNRNNANRLDNISFEETLESESTETFDIMSISSPSVSKSNRGETFIGFQDPRNIGTNAQLRTTVASSFITSTIIDYPLCFSLHVNDF